MVSITLSVPVELKQEMDQFKEINWSAVAREAIRKRVMLLATFKKFASKSKLTEKDAIRFGREVNKRVAKHY